MENLAPIVLFVYNRPRHTEKVIEALKKNKEATYSDLFVFSDAPKNEEVEENVEQVRNYIKTISGFKTITIKEYTENQGLAKSIIDGVTEVVNKYGKIIVLEDDIETSPYFLEFMNNALNTYENEKQVWNITGYQYAINTNKVSSFFFSYTSSCWGWGTWADRWKYFDKNPDKYISLMSKKDIYKFNLYGTYNLFQQIIANKAGELDTWAVFWAAEIYLNKGLCLFPAKTLVKNIGMDNSGVHCKDTSVYDGILSETGIEFREIQIRENKLATRLICDFFRRQRPKSNIVKRIIRKLVRGLYNSGVNSLSSPWFLASRDLSRQIKEHKKFITGKVLDFGCGKKPYSELFETSEYIGLEYNSELGRKNSKADFFYDGKIIPFDDNYFDCILSTQVLEHVPNPTEILSEMCRVSKPGAYLMISVPFLQEEHEEPYDFFRFSSYAIADMFRKANLEIVVYKKLTCGVKAIVSTTTFYLFRILHLSRIGKLMMSLLCIIFNLSGMILSNIFNKEGNIYVNNFIIAQNRKK